jgi:hypothetical protein
LKKGESEDIICETSILIKLLCFWILSITLSLFKRLSVSRKLDSVSIFRWDLLSWSQSIEIFLISGHNHKHKIGYPHTWGLNIPSPRTFFSFINSDVL